MVGNILLEIVGSNNQLCLRKLDNKNQLVKLQLNFKECLQDFEAIRRIEDEADKFFAQHNKLVITYEEIVKNTINLTKIIQKFLGLETCNLVPQTHKQATRPLSEVIENYQQLKSQFSDTSWSNFFKAI